MSIVRHCDTCGGTAEPNEDHMQFGPRGRPGWIILEDPQRRLDFCSLECLDTWIGQQKQKREDLKRLAVKQWPFHVDGLCTLACTERHHEA